MAQIQRRLEVTKCQSHSLVSFYETRASVVMSVSPCLGPCFLILHTAFCSEKRWLGPVWLCVNQWAVLVQIPKGCIRSCAKERNQRPAWGRHCCSSQAGLRDDRQQNPCNPWASVFGICALWTLQSWKETLASHVRAVWSLWPRSRRDWWRVSSLASKRPPSLGILITT